MQRRRPEQYRPPARSGPVRVAISPDGGTAVAALQLDHGISFANTLSLLGKPLIEADVPLGLPNWLKAIATLQTILGIMFLFLFGLGIRNRFRMKG